MPFFGASLPAGTLMDWAAGDPPPGWVECNGQTLAAADYPALFAAIGYTYGGAGPDFILPNCKGRVTVHRDPGDSDFADDGCASGYKTHTLAASEMPSHVHSQANCTISKSTSNFAPGSCAALTCVSGGSGPTASAGSGQAHNNLQPYIVVRKVIKY